MLTELFQRAVTNYFTDLPSTFDDAKFQTMVKEIQSHLLSMGFPFSLVYQVDSALKAYQKEHDDKTMTKTQLQEMVYSILSSEFCSSHMNVSVMDRIEKNKKCRHVFLFVGTNGSGKTTTLAKFARYLIKRRNKVGIIAADTFRAAAVDQLWQFLGKIKLAKDQFWPDPYCYYETDPCVVIEQGLDHFSSTSSRHNIILIDTSGRSQFDTALEEELNHMIKIIQQSSTIIKTMIHPVIILDIREGAETITAQTKFFRRIFDSCHPPLPMIGMATKLSQHEKNGGSLIAASMAAQLPIPFIGTGEHIQDLDTFTPAGFLCGVLGIKNLKMMRAKVREQVDDLNGTLEENRELKQSVEECAQSSFVSLEKIQGLLKMTLKDGQILQQFAGQLFKGLDRNSMYRFLYFLDSLSLRELRAPNKKKQDELLQDGKNIKKNGNDGNRKKRKRTRMEKIAMGCGMSLDQCQDIYKRLKTIQDAQSAMYRHTNKGGSKQKMIQQISKMKNLGNIGNLLQSMEHMM